MVSETGEKTPPLADILTEFSAVIARLGDNFNDLLIVAEVEDDLLRLVAIAREAVALETADPALAERLAVVLAQYENARAQLDLRLGAMRAFGAYLKASVEG